MMSGGQHSKCACSLTRDSSATISLGTNAGSRCCPERLQMAVMAAACRLAMRVPSSPLTAAAAMSADLETTCTEGVHGDRLTRVVGAIVPAASPSPGGPGHVVIG